MYVTTLTVIALFSVSVRGDFPFRNTSLPWKDRVDDLVGRLTINEIQAQMGKGGAGPGGPAPPIPRLEIGPYSWNTECLRGDVGAGNATSFPQAIGLAATFSRGDIFRVAEATSIEVRAKYNYFTKNKMYGDHKGISCFSPVINIVRDPRWGRIQETYGEDPYLSGELAASFVKGLQGDDDRYVRANAGCKHFAAYDGPENIPSLRFSFDAKVSERDLYSSFLPAFKTCVLAGTYSIMCSYNSVNGVPACANKELLTDILRDQWNFTGYVVSDEGAIENVRAAHKYVNTPSDVAAVCVNAGCNLELSYKDEDPDYFHITEAIQQGKLNESLVRERVEPLFYTRMRLGEFDPPEMNPYTHLDMTEVESAAHQELAIQTAAKTFVLLKNTNDTLPLDNVHYNTIAVVGPMANNPSQLFGDYSPDSPSKFVQTPLQGLTTLATNIKYTSGCNDNKCSQYDSNSVIKTISGAQYIFVCLGTGQQIEAEGNDRSDVNLPGSQLQLLQDVARNRNGAPVILLLFNAGPLNISWADQSPDVAAILECFFPAQATGEAIRRVVLNDGEGAVPAARLPVTWPMYASQIPSMTNYSMIQRTYRYFSGDPLYPFGYGLSYSTFVYDYLEVPFKVKAGHGFTGNFIITNDGKYDADEVVQMYTYVEQPTVPRPIFQLVWFDRIHIPAGENATGTFTITPENMAVWVDKKGWMVLPGKVNLYMGGQLPGQAKTVPSNILEVVFEIIGTAYLGRY